LRRQHGYTQEGLARELGISGDYVNMIENGRRTPGLALAKRIADYFGVTVDELFFYTEDERNIRIIREND
jgi:putative transcriptional regulator